MLSGSLVGFLPTNCIIVFLYIYKKSGLLLDLIIFEP